MTIHFGTDGWRAIIGDEFTFENVRQVSQAIADMLISEHCASSPGTRPSVVVGYDTRFLSDRFAADVSAVLAANGIDVYLSNAPCLTPALAHAVRQFGAFGGVMITASHNPPQFSGLKWKDATGGPAPKAQTQRIESFLHRNLQEGRAPKRMGWSGDDGGRAGSGEEGFIRRFDPIPAYFAQLCRMVDIERIARWGPRVLVDPMHGAGCGLLLRLLRSIGLRAEEIHGEPNPLFGGLCPEPVERNLRDLSCEVVRRHYEVGLALDGDGDRIGAVDETGQFVDPHRIFSLALLHLVEDRGERGTVVKTVSTTQMINRICESWRLPLEETPAGFNHICDVMRSQDVLIGGEESGGITIRGHVPDGDGVLMALVLLEVMAWHKMSLGRLVDHLMSRFGRLFYGRHDLPTDAPCNKSQMVERLMSDRPADIGGLPVRHASATDGAKFHFYDGSWVLIRPSGTEPVLRVYAEAGSREQVAALLRGGLELVRVRLGIHSERDLEKGH